MKTLSETWFAEGYIDFELKKYTLLAYLQQINSNFRENKLYPHLTDILFHYKNMISFRDNKKLLQDEFPKRLTEVHIEKLSFLYEQLIEDNELMKELEEIIDYATDKMRETITNGTAIYDFVETNINILPVGIMPLNSNEGYFILNNCNGNDTLVYQYNLTIFENQDATYRRIRTEFIDYRHRGISSSYEHIKLDLISKKSELPNPAVFAIETSLKFPVEETLLPVAKRFLVKYISEAA